jgi:hypothetical protein
MTFVEPCASPAEVARHARRAAADGPRRHCADAAACDTYHALAAFEQTVPQVPASFLDAHLTDLLWRAGVLEAYDLRRGADAADATRARHGDAPARGAHSALCRRAGVV